MKKNLTFGWRINGNADGFEQDHGRFVMEVFWNDRKRTWAFNIWTRALVGGRPDQVIVNKGIAPSLVEAKQAALREASVREREALNEDKKFR